MSENRLMTMGFWGRAVLGVAALSVASTAAAVSRRGPELTLEKLATRADSIVLGKVVSKKAVWIDSHIETQYDVKVEEQWKGGGKRALGTDAGQTFRLAVMGGETTSPPIAHYAPMQASMIAGEEVALFLDTKPRGSDMERATSIASGSGVLSGPRIIGMNQGKFSVFTDKATGKRRIARVDIEDRGMVPQDVTMGRLLSAVANREVAVAEKNVVELGGGIKTTAVGADLLKQAGATTSATVAAAAAKSAAGRMVPPQMRAVAVQDLSEFKTLVTKFSGE